MKKFIKIGAIFAAGLGVGGLAGALIEKKVSEKKWKKRMDIEVNNVIADYEGILDQIDAQLALVEENYEEDIPQAPYDESMIEVDKVYDDIPDVGLRAKEYVDAEPSSAHVDYSNMYKGGEKVMPKSSITEKNKIENAKKFVQKSASNFQQSGKPEVISSYEFGENDDYDILSLTYTADDVLLDDKNNIIYDVDTIVGVDSLTHFGEVPDDPDVVYVRNDTRMCYYEILKDERNFSEFPEYE